MSDFRTRPKDNFIMETDWRKLHVLTNHWKSDLLFYLDDLRFLQHLIDKYFIWITQKDNLREVQQMGRAIFDHTKECKLLLEKLDKHLSHLANVMDEPLKNGSDTFREEHQELEDRIAKFIKAVRENRKKLFSVTERVVDSEQLTHLMGK